VEEPAFFLAHPRAIAAFGRECNAPRRAAADRDAVRLAVHYLARSAAGAEHKLYVDERARATYCAAQGEKKRARCLSAGVPAKWPSLSVRFMGINRKAIASYLISLYCSAAVLTHDALGVLEDVDVGKFHDYGDKYV